jgi:hypothetical protein
LLAAPLLLKRTVFHTFAIFFALFLLIGCNRQPESKGPAKHYQLNGRITALDPKNQTATIDAAAIPNFMEAMTMAYPIESRAEFERLRVGEIVRATVNVYDPGDYNLSNVQEQAPPAK